MSLLRIDRELETYSGVSAKYRLDPMRLEDVKAELRAFANSTRSSLESVNLKKLAPEVSTRTRNLAGMQLDLKISSWIVPHPGYPKYLESFDLADLNIDPTGKAADLFVHGQARLITDTSAIHAIGEKYKLG